MDHNFTSNDAIRHTSASRATMLGDELTRAIDAYANEPSATNLSNFSAALVGRCASMAAAAVVSLHERVAQLEAARHGGS